MMSKKNCELCGNKARMYCESDEASLCWDCDTKVHCANFLVAKHSRNLLCHLCQSPTPWTASGPKLSPTLSVCTSCLDNNNNNKQETTSSIHSEESVEENYETETDDDDSDSEADDDDDSETDDDDEDEEDAGNQVVPLSSSSNSITSSPVRSISNDETGPWKRSRDSEATSSSGASDLDNKQLLLRPIKLLRTNDQLCDSNKSDDVVEGECTVQIVRSFLRYQQNMELSQHIG